MKNSKIKVNNGARVPRNVALAINVNFIDPKNTQIDKIVTSNDSKGNPKTYKMISTVNLTTVKDGKEYSFSAESIENYNDISSKFELEDFERNLKKNSASKIIQEIIVYLITL